MNQQNKKCTKENTLLHTDVSSVFVVQNSRKRPFIEQFEHTSINFTQKNLGTILGFFVVRDESPTSENIVNFLSSEVKKRYFAPTEKSVEDKFESTLHHVNRVLEEVANIGNIEWLGTIEGVVCVLAENSIHFSITGDSHILLLRGNTLIDISEGLASEEAAQYPLKTFVDISSGDICPHDKIIITSHELMELIPFEELQKNAIRMGEKNFIQFIETALTNECTLASTTIIDITENETQQVIPERGEIKPPPKNFFAANAFDEITDTNTSAPDEVAEIINVDELTEEAPKEYTDPRTGHIHIQGDDEVLEQPTFFENFLEKCTDISEATKEFSSKKIRHLSKKITSLKKDNVSQIDTDGEDVDVPDNMASTQPLHEKIIAAIKVNAHRIYIILKDVTKNAFAYCTIFIKKLKNKASSEEGEEGEQYTYSYHQDISPTEEKRSILPRISKITDLWSSMSNRTKFGAIGIIVFIAIVPLIFSLFSNRAQESNIEESTTQEESVQESLPAETSTTPEVTSSITDPKTLYESSEIISVTVLKDIPISIDKKTIRIFDESEQKFPIPDDAGNIMHAAAMDDLNMIFFITDTNKLYSFSPIAKKYQQQESVPEFDHAEIRSISTYLTYLYIFQDDMIMRHTRIENGFDDGKKWLDEKFDFNNTTSTSINEEIFTIQNDDITKFAEGKKQRYTKDAAIKNAHYVYATEDLSYVWVLDTQNASLFKTDKDNGKVLDTFTHVSFSDGTSLAVDETKEIMFISTPTKTLQFSLKN